jgi:hypothetical protein
MGMDLCVAVIKPSTEKWWLCHDRLRFDRDYDLFDLIKSKIQTWEIDPNLITLDWYEDEGIKARYTDPYGEKLTYTLASEFKRFKLKNDIGDFSEWSRAILIFLSELPEETKVVLWWN